MSESATAALLRQLLDAKGITRYALFLTADEGHALPGGAESASGYVLTPDGAVHAFWLDAHPMTGDPQIERWEPVAHPEQAFRDDPEYHRARRKLRLK